MPEKQNDFSDKSRIVSIPEENIGKTRIILFRGFLVKNQLWDNEDRSIHTFLSLQEKLDLVLFGMDKMPDKALGIDQKHQRGGPLLKSIFIKSGLVRARESAVSK